MDVNIKLCESLKFKLPDFSQDLSECHFKTLCLLHVLPSEWWWEYGITPWLQNQTQLRQYPCSVPQIQCQQLRYHCFFVFVVCGNGVGGHFIYYGLGLMF